MKNRTLLLLGTITVLSNTAGAVEADPDSAKTEGGNSVEVIVVSGTSTGNTTPVGSMPGTGYSPGSTGSSSGSSAAQTQEDERRKCTQKAELTFATCVSNFKNRYSTTLRQVCSNNIDGVITYKGISLGSNGYQQCKDLAEAERDAGIARCTLNKAETLANICK